MAQRTDLTWIGNEGAGLLSAITGQVHKPIHGRTILAVAGSSVALVGPPGQSHAEF